MTTIGNRLRALAHDAGDTTFCTFVRGGTSERISFAQLYQRSAAYAQAYAERGVGQGDLVFVILEHTPHLLYAFLGAILAGAMPSYLPFPTPKQRPELYWRDHRSLFERTSPSLVVTYESNLASASQSGGTNVPALVASDDLLLSANTVLPTPETPGVDTIACLQHSSGTTGIKKGVMLTHAQIARQIDALSRSIRLTADDRIVSWLPLYHDMGFIACFLTPLIRGLHVTMLDPFEWAARPRLLLEAIEHQRATLCWLPNFAFAHLVNTARPNDQWDLGSMRAFISCSEPCKSRTFERFLDRFASCGIDASKLHVSYALAENVFAATQTTLDKPVRAQGATLSCGSPIDGVVLEIRDAEGRRLPDGSIGEIMLSSPFLFEGYHRLPERTASVLRDGWYATGDLGYLDDGELFVTGRLDDLLIVNGRNFYAHDFEEVASAVPGCIPGRTVAFTVDDAERGTRDLVVLAETIEGHDPAVVCAAIKTAILERFGIALNRVQPLSRGTLIKTTSGKISRSENLPLLAGAGPRGCESDRP